MHTKKIAAFFAASAVCAVMASPMAANAKSREKYVPIVDYLHTTEKETAYDDMTEPGKPLVGAGDIPESLLKKIDTELHDDNVPEDQDYAGYYTTRDGKKTIVTYTPKKNG